MATKFKPSVQEEKDLLEMADPRIKHQLKQYTSGTNKDLIEKALGRALGKEYNIQKAVEGFRQGLMVANERLPENQKLTDKEIEKMSLLVFIAIPESGWNWAVSKDLCVGPYQFSKATAKKYGLVTDTEDKRKDIYESAKAAGSYLCDLYALLNKDIRLALSAYNSGMPLEYRRTTKRSTYEGYRKYLDKLKEDANEKRLSGNDKQKEEADRKLSNIYQNINYVPGCIAAIQVLKNKYPEFLDYAQGKITYTELEKKVEKYQLASLEPKIYTRDNAFAHKVRKGESLEDVLKIYKRFGKYGEVEMMNIRFLNGMKKDEEVRVGMKILLPEDYRSRVGPKVIPRPSTGYVAFKNVRKGEEEKVEYKVKPGDSLYKIMAEYDIPKWFLDQVKKANNLKSDMIIAGQTLVLPADLVNKYAKREKRKKDEIS
jgi:LysM repeat protein